MKKYLKNLTFISSTKNIYIINFHLAAKKQNVIMIEKSPYNDKYLKAGQMQTHKPKI